MTQKKTEQKPVETAAKAEEKAAAATKAAAEKKAAAATKAEPKAAAEKKGTAAAKAKPAVAEKAESSAKVADAKAKPEVATKAKPETAAEAKPEETKAEQPKKTQRASKPRAAAKTQAKAQPKKAATKSKPAAKAAAKPAEKAEAVEEKPQTKPATAEKKPAVKAKVEKPAAAKAAVESEPAVEIKPAVEPAAEPVAEPAIVVEPEAEIKLAAETPEAPVAEEAQANKPEAAVEKPVAEESDSAPEPAPAEEPEPASAEEPAPEPAPAEELAFEAEFARVPEYADVPGVLIAAAECAPLVKVGGLADVVGALPKYLKKLGVDARVIMPFHRQIKDRYAGQVQHLCDFQASLGWRSQYVGLEKLDLDGTIIYFIDNEFYFGGPVYCGGEFEGEQYAFFTRAVMDAIPQLDFDVRILHCNDWHTGMMPLLAKTQYHGGMQEGLRTIMTIHNLHFQGQFSHEFDRDLLRIDDSLATPQFIEHYGCDNMLKAGIVFADKVTTVSPTYAGEICGPELGESLDGVLRSRGYDLWGILNGIDVDVWNPQTDEHLPQRYSTKSLWRKEKNREALLEELGLAPAGEYTPVIAMVGRLTPQKGIDLVKCVLDDIMAEDVRMIILGSGDAEYEDFLRDAENRYKGRLCSYIGYNGELSHRIYAGADLFLMPSLFEPCGISQMISMRYGTLPIVRETGGLKDTVVPYNEFTGEGTGFSFANYNAHEMLGVIRYALSVWRNPEARKRLMTQAMEADFSFDRCARTYAELYKTL